MFRASQLHGAVSDDTDAMDIAEDFIGLLEGLGMVRAQLGFVDTPYMDVEKRTHRAVATILQMHATPSDVIEAGTPAN